MTVAFAFALLLFQTPDPVTTVSGRVVDTAVGAPVPGAYVVLVRIVPGQGGGRDLFNTPLAEGEPDPKANRLACLTGPDGTFKFRIEAPARFALFAHAEGFVRTPVSFRPETIHSLRPGEPRTDFVLRLTRQAGLSGRVVDADTGEPLRGLQVQPYSYRHTGVGRILSPTGRSSTTGEDGRFAIREIPPGEHYVEIRPPRGVALTEPGPAEGFRDAVQMNYAPTWYPGVAREQEAVPVQVAEGVDTDIGDVKIAKRRTASIRGRVFADIDGEVTLGLTEVRHWIESRSYRMVAGGRLQAGGEFQIDGVSPGRYTLVGVMKSDSGRRAASMPLEIGEYNQDGVDLHLSRGVSISGRVRIRGREDEEPALPDEGVLVGLSRVFGSAMEGDPRAVPVARGDGSFRIDGVVPDRYSVHVSKAPKGYAISEVSYNGALCPCRVVPVDRGATVHRVDVLLAPSDGSILASVTDGNRPVAEATVVLMPDGFTDEALELGYVHRKARTGEDGRATIANLLPGAYRLVAYPKDALWGDDPDLKARLRSGQEVRVASGAPAVVEVRIVGK